MSEAVESLERRLLIMAPIGRDAALVERVLERDAVTCVVCADMECLARELDRGAAAMLVTEDGLFAFDGSLARIVARQPPWSDLPILVLTRQGADSPEAMQALALLGNVTLLERPVRVATLLSAVRSALRARERQYLMRAHLQEREQADRRKDEFLAMLAHELRNPLAPIRNSISVLRMTRSPQVTAELSEMIDRQVKHMVRLVDDLMEVSRVTRGKIELRREAIELKDVIESAVETCRPLLEAARHEFTLTLPPVPLVMEADAVRLAQVFANLLNNAIKYTDAGGRIGVRAWREDGEAVVSVTDSGIGIAGDMLARVFELFVQADSSSRRAQSGLGIGLTLVRSLVELHGGTVTAASAGVGRGSTFTVRLPLALRHLARTPAPHAATALHGLPRVLVVDDNRDAADSLGVLLQMLGADVRIVHDGASALAAFDSFRPNAIFLDLGMAGMDGYEVAHRIRERSDAAHTLLIALTGWGRDKDRTLTREAGFDQHLVKPADITVLQAVLASLEG